MSSASKQKPSGARQSTADHPPMTPLPVDKDESSSVKAAQRVRVITPPIPPTPHSGHQPTRSGSLSVEKERSESALALSPHWAVWWDGVGQVRRQMVHIYTGA